MHHRPIVGQAVFVAPQRSPLERPPTDITDEGRQDQPDWADGPDKATARDLIGRSHEACIYVLVTGESAPHAGVDEDVTAGSTRAVAAIQEERCHGHS